MSEKKFASLTTLQTFLDNLKNLFATKEEISSKVDSNHSHDDKYYTEAEIDAFLESKSNTNHAHDEYVAETELENLELVTVDDVDAICGTTIQVATIESSDGVTF